MHFTINIIASALLIIISSTHGYAQQKRTPRKVDAARSRAVSPRARVAERGGIVPLVDHQITTSI